MHTIPFLIAKTVASTSTAAGTEHHAGPAPSVWAALPFVAMLLSIAILPLLKATAHWWHTNRNQFIVSVCLGSLTLGYYFFAYDAAKATSVIKHAILDEYIPFMALLFSLYVISGGIMLKGDLPATPGTNVLFLAVGTLIASVVGTTGASMVLIRELLLVNSERKHVTHTVVFFIFLVSNVGGSLLPIGDPPLFLGYLRGVPFFWTLSLWKDWLLVSAALLIIYYFWDRRAYKRETTRDISVDNAIRQKLQLRGGLNLVWLMGAVACVAFIKTGHPFPFLGFLTPQFLREAVMLCFVGLSLWSTDPRIKNENGFNYHAIIEVAALFIGIFVTMQVPLELLGLGGDKLREMIDTPMKYFWATGVLSSFLDNAPTYLVFLRLAAVPESGVEGMIPLNGQLAVDHHLLTAISLGAVFMGAMTYIGNGPNFMVKSIAEQAGVKMPSFFGYMAYSAAILVPLFLVMTLILL